MPDLTPEPTTTVKGSGATTSSGIAGETIAPGTVIYLKSSDNRYYATVRATSTETAAIAGMCLTYSSAGQPCIIQTSGVIYVGAATIVGAPYVLGSAAGTVAEHSSNASTNAYMSLLGFSTTNANIAITIVNTGVTKTAVG